MLFIYDNDNKCNFQNYQRNGSQIPCNIKYVPNRIVEEPEVRLRKKENYKKRVEDNIGS